MEQISNSDIVLQILISLGIIVISAKYLGTLSKKIGFPQIAGMIIAGLLLRFLPWFKNFGADEPGTLFGETDKFISYIAEIGVILIMFSAGLGTNLKSLINTTMFIVSQRTNSIMDLDEILVLEEGRLVGKGSHKDLLETCEVYKEIHESQYKQNIYTDQIGGAYE